MSNEKNRGCRLEEITSTYMQSQQYENLKNTTDPLMVSLHFENLMHFDGKRCMDKNKAKKLIATVEKAKYFSTGLPIHPSTPPSHIRNGDVV